MKRKQNQRYRDKDGSLRTDYMVRAEYWEDGEFVITIGGAPIGQTVSARDAKIIVNWLRTAAILITNADADRYQWLKNNADCEESTHHILFELSGEQWDAAIDAALRAKHD